MVDSIYQLACAVSHAFVSARNPQRDCDDSDNDDDDDAEEEVEDAHARFRLWAGNLGAFHPAWDTKSLDHRLRQEHAVTQRVKEILTELTDLLEKFTSSATDTERAPEIQLHNGTNETDKVVAEFLNLETSAACGVSWMVTSVTDAVRRLFKISRLIEKSTTRDRYARAEAASEVQFDYSYDIAHVQAKHGHHRAESWLVDRLGKAITKRRVFLRYAREHRVKLDSTPEFEPSHPLPISTEVAAQAQNAARSLGPSRVSKPSQQQTTASSLAKVDIHDVDTGFDDDDRSFYTKATSVSDGRATDRLRVANLDEFATVGEPFQCPYCCTIQKFNGQISWERHVFSDLRAYLCTSRDCSMVMFARKQDWTDHELENHRRRWQCQLCSHLLFKTEDALLHHIRDLHKPDMTADIAKALLKTSSRPQSSIEVKDCPLCDWQGIMREVNPRVAETELLVVDSRRFMKHLAGHLEELALFAIPRGVPSDDPNASGGTGDSVNVIHQDTGNAPHETPDDISPPHLSLSGSPSSSHNNGDADSLTGISPYQGQYDEPDEEAYREEVYRKALADIEQVLGHEHPDTLTSAHSLALVQRDRLRYDAAEKTLRRAVEGREKVLGKEHPDTLTSISALAEVLMDQGRYRAAETLGRRALAGRDKVLGKVHPDTLTSVYDLALMSGSLGDYDAAEVLFVRARDGRESILDKGHPDRQECIKCLIEILLDQEKYTAAEAMCRSELENGEEALGKRHMETCSGLLDQTRVQRLLQEDGRKGAVRSCRRSLHTKEKLFGEEDSGTLQAVYDLAKALHDLKKYEESERLYRRALRGRKRVLGAKHLDTLDNVRVLAQLLRDQGQDEAAKEIYRWAIEGREHELRKDQLDALGGLNVLFSMGLFGVIDLTPR